MMSLDALLRRRRRPDYTCVHLAAEAWALLTGRDLSGAAAATAATPEDLLRSMRPLERRQDPCIVLMREGWEAAHIGVFHRGRILHLTQDAPQFVAPPVATAGFRRVSYYA